MTQENANPFHQALHDLHAAFQDFKTHQEKRLESLEHQHADLNTSLEKKMEIFPMQTKRPGLIHQAPLAEPDAFQNYLKKGIVQDWDQKKMSVSEDPQGGYLVPASMASQLVKTLQSYPAFRSLAHTLTVSTDALEMLLDKDQADAGWAQEWDERPETDTPELARLRIPVHELYARPRCTQQLLDDAQIDVEAWLVQKIADTMAMLENQAFILGDGIGKPRGFLTYPYAPLGQGEWGKIETLEVAAADLTNTADIFIELMHSLKPAYLVGACWLMSRSVISQVRRLKDQNDLYLWQPSLTVDQPSTLLGYPVHIMDDMPAYSTDKACAPIAFGNFKQAYTIVDRSGLNLLRDPYSAKPYVEFYATRRVGGDVVNFEALKLIHTTV